MPKDIRESPKEGLTKAGGEGPAVPVSATNGRPYLEVREMTRRFPSGGGIEGFNLAVPKGTLVTLLGPSGCGKTTALRCLAGIDRPQSGEIQIGDVIAFSAQRGVDVPPERRDIGMVFQSYALWPHMTAGQNVAFPLRSRKVSGSESVARAREMLELVGLDHLMNESVAHLSGGQQQRVALARALVYKPKLLLFDEPLSNLDAQLRDNMRRDIRRIQQELGITAVYVTHDRREAMTLSDWAIVLSDGCVIQQGTPRDLLELPASRFVASLLGYAVLEGTVQGLETVNGVQQAAVTIAGVAAQPPVRARCDARVSSGASVAVCLRPADIRLTPVTTSHGQDGAVQMTGRVYDVILTGSEIEYGIDLGGVTLRALSLVDTGFSIGDAVGVRYSPERAYCVVA